MVVREKFEHELRGVQEQFLKLSNLAITTLNKSIDALLNHDVDAALSIIENDIHINRMEEEINDRVILLLAKQQPVATDLRRLIVLLKAAHDMERVGDYAVNIAKENIRIGKADFVSPIKNIEEMRSKTITMLTEVMKAFIEENIEDARKIAELDDQVDQLYGQTIQQLLKVGAENPHMLSQVTQLSFVCRYLERSADHATNIAEQLFYLVKGRHYELNN
ncbi:phosphate signaling complex protein PhoU [Paenisporosarcina quisquiliarum]|uniref:Phosphate-specific transport system accessory protein PhoU n=1 Tax=Paenisporosarcina quisquiliarum TaxID=365346 RepID=A0A9X3LDI2_9BACL|nr:phosphate signaling complex protein PhoU [Paenisporosarcina quisquiliarum]MCZ8536030.1 phosphate signaling complex protein PhoU [Paenisporosarcina quisquiliarum]